MGSIAKDVTFYCEHTDGNRYVTPMNRQLIFDWSKDSEFQLYRKNLKTKLVFTGDDYYYFLDIENGLNRCDDVTMTVTIDCQGTPNDFYEGRIRMTQGEWDLDHCRVEFSVVVEDATTCLKRYWEKEISLFSLVITKQETKWYLGILEYKNCGGTNPDDSLDSSCLPDPLFPENDGYTVKEHTATDVIIHWVVDTQWVREKVASVTQPPGDGWIDIGGGLWARAPQTKYNNAQSYVNPGDVYLLYDLAGENSDPIDNGMLLNDVLEQLLSEITNSTDCSSLSIVSNFFGINPDATNPANDAYTLAAENTQSVMVWQKSDVINHNASNNASKAITTFKRLLENLKARFNLGVSIDGNTIRIEHISYFEQAQGIDLSSDVYLTGTRKYTYLNERLPYKEEFKSMDEKETPNFRGVPIIYENCTDGAQVTSIQSDQITTDISEMVLAPDDFSLDGLAMAVTFASGGNYYFISEIGELLGTLALNNHLAWANLHEHYYRWDRPQLTGTMNNLAATFESAKRQKVAEFETILCCPSALAIDAAELIKHPLGWGEVENLTLTMPGYKLEGKLNI